MHFADRHLQHRGHGLIADSRECHHVLLERPDLTLKDGFDETVGTVREGETRESHSEGVHEWGVVAT